MKVEEVPFVAMTDSATNLINGVGQISTNDTRQSSAVKTEPVKNVHCENGSFVASHQDPVKIPRNKKLAPENRSNASNEHIVNARRRFELELGKGRGYSVEKYTNFMQALQPQQENANKQTRLKESDNIRVPVATSSNLIPPCKLSNGEPSLANLVVKDVKAADVLRVSTEIPRKSVSKSTIEQRMSDRFTKLQQVLKQCDESHHRDYVVMLLRLSPPDLCRHGIELEKRALRLHIEEGKELERMNSLNMLAKSASEYPMQATQWSRK